MFNKFLKKVIGDRHAREVKKLQPLLDEINNRAEALADLSDDEIRAKTDEFRGRIAERIASLEEELEEARASRRASEDASERADLTQRIASIEEEQVTEIEGVLEEILPEAFAVVKDTCRRLVGTEITVTGQKLTWDMVPYDVQLIGGHALHHGNVAEMATGEGKTLVATMPLYLNALAGRGAHLVTVNTYLAQRDAEWMATVFGFLGLTVDVIDLHPPGSPQRRAAYEADITYGTNNEFGFDYLRDNMVRRMEERVQGVHFYAILDEVDSILVDEARTPLIISGPAGKDTSGIYPKYKSMVAKLHRQQTGIVNDLVGEAERYLADEDEYPAGERLLAAKRGAPKHKRLLKMFADQPGLQKLIQRVEADYMREKRLGDIDELLFYAMDEKGQTVVLSDKGLDELSPGDPDAFVAPDVSDAYGIVEGDESLTPEQKGERRNEIEAEYSEKSQKIHAIHQLLKAYTLFQKDERYIIGEDGSIVIVDEFTGRQMPGRRWSDGLHQAVEAKEGVEVRGETQTLATITIQNFFRMYDKLAGMTGTAETEENEFHEIYGLEVLVIPTNRPIVRDDRDDLVYRTLREKYNALMDEIERLHAMELPVLVGTTDVSISETLSRMLKRRGITHSVLNAKQHKSESEIVAQAGQPGAVTIATNMAGRGTDIKLASDVRADRTVAWAREKGLDIATLLPPGPQEEDPTSLAEDDLLEVGGLHILGSARHESRRIDRQLRGRAGRQGDAGASQFFLSFEDDLMRMFLSDKVVGFMDKLGGIPEGEPISHPLVTRNIGTAQMRVEGNNFEARKRLLDYDDVMNQQREVIYDLRLFALEGGEDLKGEAWEMVEHAMDDLVEDIVDQTMRPEDWDLAELRRRLLQEFLVNATALPQENRVDHEFDDEEEVRAAAIEAAREQFHHKIEVFGENIESILSFVVLSVIDEKWKDHLYDLDHLKASISFRGYGQKDPLVEYKREAFDMFVDLMAEVRKTVATYVLKAQIQMRPPQPPPPTRLAYSGPTGPSGSPGPGRAPGAGVGAAAGALDATGVARRARGADGLGLPPGPDPSQLATNRTEERPNTPVTGTDGPGRNDPCPCGSGKKYKKCHGRAG